MSTPEVFFTDVSKFINVLGFVVVFLAALLHEPKSMLSQRIPFALGISGLVGYFVLVNGTLNANAEALIWVHPWIAGLLFVAPPALWFALRGRERWPFGLWVVHFTPALLALVMRSIRFALDPDLMREDMRSTFAYELTFPGNYLYIKTYVVYFMSFVSAFFYLVLADFTQSSKTALRFLSLLTALSLILFYPYLLGDFWESWRPTHLVLTLLVETLILAYTFYIIVERYRGMLQVERDVNEVSVPGLMTNDPFGLYLEQVFQGEKRFLREDYSMDLLSSDSGFSAAAWRAYFKSKDTTFLIVKKRMRIDHATQLIVNGYLDNHTVEALTSEIGYASRSTFYTAFQEIMGKPFPQYLQELRNS